MEHWAQFLSFLSDGLPPSLVWGLVPRLMGGLYVVAFASLVPQAVPLVGRRGVSPVCDRLARLREDYPGPGRFLRLPTLFWLNSSDGVVRALPWLGIVNGLFAVYGGELGPWALFACWVLHISLDVCGLWYPWDCLVFEAGFLSLFLPAVPGLAEGVAASVLPYPALAFMWRLLIIRLMWGFAKLKFIGTRPGDDMYLRGFLTWMPLPTPLGWRVQHAPRWFLRASYGFMWLVEVVCPLLGFFTGMPRVLGALGLIALMVGIWATGNWGFFNLGYAVLCIVLLDAHATLFDIPSWQSLWATPWAAFTHAVLFVVALGSLFYFVFNSWCSQTWLHWPFDDVTYKRPWLEALIRFYRGLAPLRIVNAYGVFPPNSAPAIKMVPVFQGSADGTHWEDFRFRYMASQADSRPAIAAPHHPRIDHAVIYAGSGMTDANYLSSLIGAGKPYGFSTFSHASWVDRLMQRLLEGSPEARSLLADDNPFAEAPPKYVRVIARALTPTSLADRRQTGRFWHQRDLTILVPATEHDAQVWVDWLPPPECFHPDNVHWRKSSPALQAMLAAFDAGLPHQEAVRVQSPLTEQDVRTFWEEVIVAIDRSGRRDWANLQATAEALEARYGTARMRAFERLLERYAFALRMRLEPHLYGEATPRIEKRSNFRFHLLLHELILDGREAFERVYAEPELAAGRAQSQSDESALYGVGVFRFETIRYHAATLRMTERITTAMDQNLPGILEFRQTLRAYEPAGELWLPDCRQLANGEWHTPGFGTPREERGTSSFVPSR